MKLFFHCMFRYYPDWTDGERISVEFSSQLVILTEFVHGDIKGFQFGAAAQEICRNILHAVLAHIKQLNLRQTKRCAQLSDTVSEKKKKIVFTILQMTFVDPR